MAFQRLNATSHAMAFKPLKYHRAVLLIQKQAVDDTKFRRVVTFNEEKYTQPHTKHVYIPYLCSIRKAIYLTFRNKKKKGCGYGAGTGPRKD